MRLKCLTVCLMAISSIGAYAEDGFEKFRLGGYGEMVAGWQDYGYNRFTGNGSSDENRASIAIPRMILAMDYKFNSKWRFGTEIEFEYGGTGVAKEIEYSEEGGEYEIEIEKGGEVVLEQFHLTRSFHKAFNVKVGHLIVPVGLTNAHHEPINFFGTSRPEGESALLPTTWHENGMEIFGSLGRKSCRFDYQLFVVAGLNPNGFRRQDWIKQGKQSAFEVNNFSSPAFAGRIDYLGVKGLRFGVSAYHCSNTAKNSDKPERMIYKDKKLKIPVSVYSADVQYKSKNFVVRGNVVVGHLGESLELYNVNKNLSNNSGYSRTPAAAKAVTYAVEAGYNVGGLFGDKAPRIFLFGRYDYYNPQESTEDGMLADKRFQTDMWTVGLNYFALPNIVIKGDYSHRIIGKGNYNDECEFSVGVAYVGWFVNK